MKHRYFIAYKPYGMLSQFTRSGNRPVLGDLGKFPKDVYPVGRLDADSEGLLILTNDPVLHHRLLDPAHGHARTYLAQVEGIPSEDGLAALAAGVRITVRGRPYTTLPCTVQRVLPPAGLPARLPPIRFRKSVPDAWLALTITEGKNRQVRKMTAAVGLPTLRLIRVRIEHLELPSLTPGTVHEQTRARIYRGLGMHAPA